MYIYANIRDPLNRSQVLSARMAFVYTAPVKYCL